MNHISIFLHKSMWGILLINWRRILKQQINVRLYDDKTALMRMYQKRVGRKLNIENPMRFTEKLQWEKLYHRDPLMTTCADKIQIRSYLTQKGYGHYLVPTVGTWRKVEEIDITKLPDKCILKASHGSSMYIVKNKTMEKMPVSWRLVMKSWLKMNIYIDGREWPYKNVPPGIICEEFIEPKTSRRLKDYKFFCFAGKPEYIQVDSDLMTKHCIDFFDDEWKRLPLRCQYPNSEDTILKPKHFELMMKISRDLSAPFPHVRVDFYEYDDQLRIGELTFFDGSGLYAFHPDEYDFVFGRNFPLIPYEEH